MNSNTDGNRNGRLSEMVILEELGISQGSNGWILLAGWVDRSKQGGHTSNNRELETANHGIWFEIGHLDGLNPREDAVSCQG